MNGTLGRKKPRDDARYQWTSHVVEKMRYYGLSESRIRRILHSPHRKEEGVAPGTSACMQKAGSAKHPFEIWVMYQELKKSRAIPHLPPARKIISAWRFPGTSKKREPIP